MKGTCILIYKYGSRNTLLLKTEKDYKFTEDRPPQPTLKWALIKMISKLLAYKFSLSDKQHSENLAFKITSTFPEFSIKISS